MYSNFKPINDGVLVKLSTHEKTTSTGIIIPKDAQEKMQQAVVVHAGNSKQLVVQDKVFLKKYVGHVLNEEYVVVREEDILGVL
jgi:co-chaperonin GroES (HSP10)